MDLRPVSFVYRVDAGGDGRTPEYGLIAEEVAAIAPELVVYDDAGQPYSVRYHLLTPMLLAEVQQQQRTIADLRDRLDRLADSIERDAASSDEGSR